MAPSTVLLLLLASSAVSVSTASRAFQPQAEQQLRMQARQILGQASLLGLDRASKQLRVLAHGDSITEGWINTLWIKTPWTPMLQQQLQQKLGRDWRVEVVNGGMGGAGVLDALNPLLQQQLGDARNQNRPYHFIVFEAGINDILMKNQKAPLIFERMKEMWAAANNEGSTVLVIPTMPTNAQGEPEQQRRELTNAVRAYIAQQNAAGNMGLQLLDLEAPFDYYKLSEQRRQQLFDDGIHLTQKGYELMGDLIYHGLEHTMGL